MSIIQEYSQQEANPIENIENSLLSLLVNSGETEPIFYVLDKLNPEDFSNQFNTFLYETIVSLTLKHNVKIDVQLILSKFKKVKEQARARNVLSANFSINNLIYYINEVKNASRTRNLKLLLLETNLKVQDAQSSDVTMIASELEDKLLQLVSHNKFEFSTPADLMPELIMRLKSGKQKIEVETSIPELDELTFGLPPGYITIAARPSFGKSMLALQMAEHNAKNGVRTAFFSLEMPEMMVMRRALSLMSGVNLHKINCGDLDMAELVDIELAADKLSALPLHIDPSGGLAISQIFSRSKRLKIKHPDLNLIVIDYVQLVRGSSESDDTNTGLSKISQAIQAMAKALKLPVVVLSQLSRACETREDKRPRLSDLRGSGSLEQESDIVIFLYNESHYNQGADQKLTELIVAKNRNGPLGTVLVNAHKDVQKFESIR